MPLAGQVRALFASGRLSRVGLVAALLVACALVLTLARQAGALRKHNALLARSLVEPVRGMWVPTFTTVTLDGDTVHVGETHSGGRQLLFVFTTSCPYCRSMIPTWTALAHTATAATSDRPPMVVGVSLDSVATSRRYVEQHRLPYPVISLTDRKLAALYRTRTVPLTLVLDSIGRVAHARIGEFHDAPAMDSVLAALAGGTPPQSGDASTTSAYR